MCWNNSRKGKRNATFRFMTVKNLCRLKLLVETQEKCSNNQLKNESHQEVN